jgi:hypothetical protein
LAYAGWKDPTDPLGSLLEVFKWARIAGAHGIFPSVFAGQVFHESDLGLKQDAILGIKATEADIAAGTTKRLRTWEVLKPSAVEKLKERGDWIENIKVYPDGMIECKCWQLFHFQEGLSDDFERLITICEKGWVKYGKPRPQKGWTPLDFLRKVTQGPPAYATDKEYADQVMARIIAFDLVMLDEGFQYPAT